MSTAEINRVLNQPRLKVLVLEDSPADAILLIKELQQAGFEVDWQRVDTESAFHEALSPNIDLILADFSLPSYDGVTAVQYLRGRGLDAPFILISGKIGEETAVDAIKQGADDYLLKDRLARLAPAVQHALETRRLRRQQIQMSADNVQLIHQLTKRVKELTTLHQVSRLLHQDWVHLLDLFREVVVLLPDAFQHRNTTAARIRFGDIEVLTNHFRMTSQHYAAHFCTDDQTRGVVEAVVLTESCTEHAEGFLVEEKYLIDTIAGMLQRFLSHRASLQQLRENQKLLMDAQRIADLGSWEMDLVTGRLRWCLNTLSIFGLQPEQFTGQIVELVDRIHPQDRKRFARCLEEADQRGGLFEIEYRILRMDGAERILRDKGDVQLDGNGRPLRRIGLVMDITDRRAIEKSLQESEQRYRTVVQNSPDIILIQQGDNITFVNQAGISLLRAGTADNIVGKSPEDFVHPDFSAQVRSWLEKLQQEPAVVTSTTIQMIALDGTLIDADVQASSILNDGQLQIQFVCRDITESKRADLELLRRTNDLKRFNSAAVGRELRMIELKKQINELSEKCGQPRPYSLDFADG